jgi:hypothetical protein
LEVSKDQCGRRISDGLVRKKSTVYSSDVTWKREHQSWNQRYLWLSIVRLKFWFVTDEVHELMAFIGRFTGFLDFIHGLNERERVQAWDTG